MNAAFDLPIPARPETVGHTPSDSAPRILVANSLRFNRDILRGVIRSFLASAAIVVASSVAEVNSYLDDRPVDLLVTDVVLDDGDVLDFLPEWMHHDRRVGRVLVVSSHSGPHVLETLRRYPIAGFFDEATDTVDAFEGVLHQIAIGGFYWSPSVRTTMTQGVPSESVWADLTTTERLVLAAIGDGADDKSASDGLQRSISAVRGVRERLHRKLGVRQRSELMKVASRFGCVVFTNRGFIRLGYRTLLQMDGEHRRRGAAVRS